MANKSVDYRMTAEHQTTGEYKNIICESITDAMQKAKKLRAEGWLVVFDRENEERHDSYTPKPERAAVMNHPSHAKRVVSCG